MQAGQPLEQWIDARERRAAGRSGFRRAIGLTNPWDLAGKCEKPVTVELYGKSRHGDPRQSERNPMTVRISVKCRKCGWCRKMHAGDWAARALAEYDGSARTWMATLTLAPEQHARVRALATKGVGVPTRTGGVRYVVSPDLHFEQGTPEMQFARLVRIIGHDLTLFLKRVRKNAHAPFRYLLVAEAHQSGLPHFHMLVHEKSEQAPIRKQVMKDAWDLGFSKFSLVESSGGAVYVCKYMAKDALTRVRASFKYGQSPYSQNGTF